MKKHNIAIFGNTRKGQLELCMDLFDYDKNGHYEGGGDVSEGRMIRWYKNLDYYQIAFWDFNNPDYITKDIVFDLAIIVFDISMNNYNEIHNMKSIMEDYCDMTDLPIIIILYGGLGLMHKYQPLLQNKKILSLRVGYTNRTIDDHLLNYVYLYIDAIDRHSVIPGFDSLNVIEDDTNMLSSTHKSAENNIVSDKDIHSKSILTLLPADETVCGILSNISLSTETHMEHKPEETKSVIAPLVEKSSCMERANQVSDYTCVLELFDNIWSSRSHADRKILRIKSSMCRLYYNQEHARTLELVNSDDIAKHIISEIHKFLRNNKNNSEKVIAIQDFLLDFGQTIAFN